MYDRSDAQRVGTELIVGRKGDWTSWLDPCLALIELKHQRFRRWTTARRFQALPNFHGTSATNAKSLMSVCMFASVSRQHMTCVCAVTASCDLESDAPTKQRENARLRKKSRDHGAAHNLRSVDSHVSGGARTALLFDY
jgi:hypothetical protein